jgi:hypothetical protein
MAGQSRLCKRSIELANNGVALEQGRPFQALELVLETVGVVPVSRWWMYALWWKVEVVAYCQ